VRRKLDEKSTKVRRQIDKTTATARRKSTNLRRKFGKQSTKNRQNVSSYTFLLTTATAKASIRMRSRSGAGHKRIAKGLRDTGALLVVMRLKEGQAAEMKQAQWQTLLDLADGDSHLAPHRCIL